MSQYDDLLAKYGVQPAEQNGEDEYDALLKKYSGDVQADKPKDTRGITDIYKDVSLGMFEGMQNVQAGIGGLWGLATGDMDNRKLLEAKDLAKQARAGMSTYQQDKDRSSQVAVEKAEKEGGFWSGLGEGIMQGLDDPMMAISRQLPLLAVGGISGGATKAAAGQFIRQATEKTMIELGAAGAVASMAAMQGSDIGADAYERVLAIKPETWAKNVDFQALIKQGESEDAAKHAIALREGRIAAAKAAAISIASQKLPGGSTLEKVMMGAGGKGGIAGMGIGALKGAAGESLQESIEEGGGQKFSNEAVQAVDPTQSSMQGVGGAAGQGAAVAAILGGTAGGVSGFTPSDTQAAHPAGASPSSLPPTAAGASPLAAPPPLNQANPGASVFPDVNESIQADELVQADAANPVDRMAELDAEYANLQARKQELNDPANGYGPMFDTDRAEIFTRQMEIAQERAELELGRTAPPVDVAPTTAPLNTTQTAAASMDEVRRQNEQRIQRMIDLAASRGDFEPVKTLPTGTPVVGNRAVSSIPSGRIAQVLDATTNPNERIALEQEMARRGMEVPVAVEPTPTVQEIAAKTASSPIESTARTLNEDGRATDGKPINPGDVFRTLSGRNATPYPKQKSEKYASQWLIENATAEAESRGDNFNALTFKNSKPLKDGTLTTADREGMLMYLFSQQPDVVPSILKPLTGEAIAPKPSQPAQKESQAQGAEGKTVEVSPPATTKPDEVSAFDQRYPTIAAAEQAIKAKKLKQVAVFKDGDQYRIGARGDKKQAPSTNLIQRIKQLGGIHTRYRADVIGDKAGAPGLFSNTGKGLDDLATALQAEGFAIDTAEAGGGVDALTALIQRAVNSGETVLNYAGQQAAAEKKISDDFRDNLKEEIAKLGGNPARNATTKQLIEMRENLRAVAQQKTIEAAAQIETLIGKELTGADWDAILNASLPSVDQYAADLDQAALMQREQEENDAAYRRHEEETQVAAGQAAPRGARQGAETGRAEPGNQEAQESREAFGLTGETPEEIRAREEAQAAKAKSEQDAADKAEAEAKKKRIDAEVASRQKASAENFVLGQGAEDALAGQGDIFGGLTQQEVSQEAESIEQLRDELRKIEDKILLAAGERDNIEQAMSSRKVDKSLKDKRNTIRDQVRAAQKRLDDAQKQPATSTETPAGKPAANYKAGDRITSEKDVFEGDIVTFDGKQWMAKVKRGDRIPLLPFVDGKPIVSADTVRKPSVRDYEITHTGTNYYGHGGQPKPVQPAANAPTPTQKAPDSAAGKPAVSQNTVFTEDAAAAARARLKAKLGRLNTGLDPETMLDGITLAGYHIEKGARTFAAYAKAMIEDLGDAVKPYLKSWYAAVSMDPRASGFDGLDDLAAVQSLDIEAILKETGDTNEPNQRSSTNLERDRQNTRNQNDMGAQGVRPGRERDGGPGEPGVRRPAQENQPAGGERVPGREAAPAGTESDFSPFAEAPGAEPGVAGSDLDQRSGDLGLFGQTLEPAGTEATDRVAQGGIGLIEKRQAQTKAQNVKVVPGNRANISESLPFLLEGQKDDVAFAEARFAKPDGYGVLFTNGTGTGKTYSGLGVIKRFERQGKSNILIVVPSDKIASDWVRSGQDLKLDITALENTNDAGQGIVITTYANMGANNALVNRKWDLVVADESHYMMQAKDGGSTQALDNLRAITMHPRGRFERHSRLYAKEIARRSELIDKITFNSRIMNLDDTMDQMIAALRDENATMEAEAKKLDDFLREKREQVKEEVDAAQGINRTRTVFLSATPFAYEKTVDYAEGYLFNYAPDGARGGYNSGSPFDRFMMQHFGYRMRYNKLNEPGPEVNRGLMQRQFNSWLKSEKVLSGRILDVEHDYDRKFILVDSAIGAELDRAMQWIWDRARDQTNPNKEGYSALQSKLSEKFDHLTRRYLLEAIKAKEAIPIIRAHLDMGRKVVVFHDFKKGGGFNPVRFGKVDATQASEKNIVLAYNAAIEAFNAEFSDLIESPMWNAASPIDALSAAFPDALLFNGDVPAKKRRENATLFNDDESGKNLIIGQSAAMKEGVSLHDTTGKHQRVLINLGLPTQPTTAIQQEGRIFRVGQASNAIFRYLNTGTNWERFAFATSVAQRASAAENLAVGEEARALMDAFIEGFEESDTYPAGHDGEGTGGKARDQAANQALTEWDRAMTLYWAQQKKTSRTKAQEGVDYFATPEPLGLKMVEWADIRDGDKSLEPSAGHGAIARWLPDNIARTVIEPSAELSSRLRMVMMGDGVRLLQEQFEQLDTAANKYDAIVMNPPFGSGGSTAIQHVAKAAKHLNNGGRIVALIPTGPAADKKFEKWFYEEEQKPVKPLVEHPKLGPIYKGDTIKTNASWMPEGNVVRLDAGGNVYLKNGPSETTVNPAAWTELISAGPRTETIRPAENLYLRADIKLPQVTFERAGTRVAARVVVIEKQTDKDAIAQIQQVNRDFSDADDIKDFFARIQDSSIPTRAIPKNASAGVSPLSAATGQPSAEGKKLETDAEEIAYTTKKGKVLHGVIAKDITEAQAKEYDPYTWKKDGGFFIRMEHVKRPNEGETNKPNDTKFSRAIRTGDFLLIENPTRDQAENLLRRSKYQSMRGLRDPETGKLYIWDANDAIHHQVARELGITDDVYERLEFDDVGALRKGVFSGEPGYGGVITDRPSAYEVREIRMSRKGGAAKGIALRDLNAMVDRVRKSMDNLPTVHVLTSPMALDLNNPSQARLREFIEQAGALEDVEGAAHEGEIYLFASGLADEARAEHVLAVHEITHYGLRAVFGMDLDPVLQSIWATNANIRKQATALREKLGLASNVAAVEEILADMEPAELVKLTGWRRLAQVVRDWFRGHGFTALANRIDSMLKAGLDGQRQADLLVADVVNAARGWVKGGKRVGKVASGTVLADARKLADDLPAQEKWLNTEARMRGFQDIEDLAAKDYKVFENLAKLWREKHPADVMMSRARQSQLPGVQQSPPAPPPSQQSANLQGGASGNQSVFNTPEPSKMDDIIFKLQDKHIDLKRAIQGITDAGRQIADKWNTYMQEELFHGRTAKRVQDFADRELAPMLREMALRKVSIADLDKYLWARHAKEANALIEQRDPGVMVDDVTGQPKGSGMTDQEADDYFAGLSQDQRNQLDAIARQVDRMIARTRDLYVSYGLENRDTVQGWADMFQHYVPLMREDHDGGMGIGQGFSIKGREAKHRTGSTRAVADVLANIATQRERAIVRGEKNRVAVSLAGLVKLNPAPDFWTLDKIPQERVLNEQTGLVETREVPNYRTRDNVIIAKIKDSNGNVQERAIVLNENDERAVRLAKAMKNIDIPMLEGWLGAAAAVTRYFSAINTQYNPVFGVVNLIRDAGAGALNLSSTALKGKERVVTNPRRIASAVAGIYSDARKERKGQVGTSPWAALWEEFTEEGGQTGYRDMFRTSNERANAMQHVMDPTSWTESKWGQFFTANGALKVPLVTAQKAATPLFNWLSDFNLAMENAVRLSAYKEAVDSGMSKQQAASLAKNLTVNFNRKGAWGAQAGALYAFFNAATQGTARIGETLTRRDYKTGKYSVSGIGKKIIGGGVMLGVMQAVALAMAGYDDDEPPEFIRERNLVVPLMDGKYISIPMPLGFHVIPNIGRIATETLMGRRGSAIEGVIDLMGITFEAFNPMGSAGWSTQTVLPTLFDPMAAIIENKDWTGKPIAKEKFSNTDPEPGYAMAKDNASSVSTAIAYAINLATGGSEYTAGKISPTPDQIDYLWGQVTGGVGREGNKLYQSVESMFTGEELPPHKIPLAGRLYGNTQSSSAMNSRFYDNIRDMKRHKAEYMGRMEDGDTEGAQQYLADNPEAEMIRAVGAYESKVQQLRSAKRKAIEQGDSERAKEIEQRTKELMEQFNQQIGSAKQ